MHKIGWDIGGAHLKAVMLDAQHQVQQVLQIPCRLWLGLPELKLALQQVLNVFDVQPTAVAHAVTMTGELVDLFPNRESGVLEIANTVTTLLGEHVWFYTANVDHDFVQYHAVSQHVDGIASANWHASAQFIASVVETAVMLDIGSTTTDIIPIMHNKAINVGLTDAERMQRDSLVYTGVVRTPVMALAQKLTLNGKQVNVAAEHFATTADVYRITGELPEALDVMDTADGQGKNKKASIRRLARMVGHDLDDYPMQVWLGLAENCRAQQILQLKQALLKHLKDGMPVIGVGAGAFLAKELASELNRDYLALSDIIEGEVLESVSVCFPAYAVCRLCEV